VNNGKSVIFWEDVWEGEVPLKLIFPKLYEYSGEQNCLVSECWDSGEWVMDFARPLSQNEARQWDSLLVLLQNSHIIDSNDSVKWVLEKSGRYTTKSMYRYLLHRGISNVHMIKMWKCRLPMKLKIFMWLVFHGRVQAGVVLGGMSWKGDTRCVICSVLETIDHIFFACPVARLVWGGIKDAFGFDRQPRGLSDFLDNWKPLGVQKVQYKTFFSCSDTLVPMDYS
jgi:hypothetical protein